MTRRIAVVLFNLGGPDGPDAVQPFLQNLFSDPAIITAPAPVRFVLSRVISRTRAPNVIGNYAMMDAGGGSPLLPETEKQAEALNAALSKLWPGDTVRCFIAMRYWHPFTHEAVAEVKNWGATDVVLLPLYPQYSTTTTGSSLAAWEKAGGPKARTICCYPFAEEFIEAHVSRILDAHVKAGSPQEVTLLLSAHGLPERVIKAGDPYQWQCEMLAEMLAGRLPQHWEIMTCYQSRVGPLKWIGPSTETEIEKAASAKRHILIAPTAFVSEHIETLVELGEEYRLVAEKHGAASYTRVEALGIHEGFITALADQVRAALDQQPGSIRSCAGSRLCPPSWKACPMKQHGARHA
jgi:protoporphyrin/coproporphyrin ferrochelatase